MFWAKTARHGSSTVYLEVTSRAALSYCLWDCDVAELVQQLVFLNVAQREGPELQDFIWRTSRICHGQAKQFGIGITEGTGSGVFNQQSALGDMCGTVDRDLGFTTRAPSRFRWRYGNDDASMLKIGNRLNCSVTDYLDST